MPPEVSEYLRELLSRLRAILGHELVGVYLGGSVALDDYRAGTSDLDVAVVVVAPVLIEKKREIANALRHEVLPCPARGLELVVYTSSTARSGTGEPAYELNLNTGSGMPYVCSFAPEGEAHWYAVDRAVVRARGIPVDGPPAGDLFAPIPREVLLGRVTDSVRWYAEHPWAGADNAVLNACRAWRWASEGTWSSKSEAGEWALERTAERALVEAARRARATGERLEPARVGIFVEEVLRLLEREAA